MSKPKKRSRKKGGSIYADVFASIKGLKSADDPVCVPNGDLAPGVALNRLGVAIRLRGPRPRRGFRYKLYNTDSNEVAITLKKVG